MKQNEAHFDELIGRSKRIAGDAAEKVAVEDRGEPAEQTSEQYGRQRRHGTEGPDHQTQDNDGRPKDVLHRQMCKKRRSQASLCPCVGGAIGTDDHAPSSDGRHA